MVLLVYLISLIAALAVPATAAGAEPTRETVLVASVTQIRVRAA